MIRKTVCALALCFAASHAYAARTCTYDIEGNDQMQYSLAEIKVDADCTEVEVTLRHAGKLPKQTMGHNWVLARTADFQAVANAGISAGLDKDYVPEGDKRVIAHTKVVGGGESTSVKFPVSRLSKGGDYTFFCSFPGHYGLMKGKFIY
jgi:azurin